MSLEVGQSAHLRIGNEELYRQIQEDALTLIESIGFSATEAIAGRILAALAPGEVSAIVHVPDIGRIYVPRSVVENCLDRVRQGFDYWPAGLGTGGMAAYVVDKTGPRLADLEDLRRLASIYARTDELTSLQLSFNPSSRIKKGDTSKREESECACLDIMVETAGGKLNTPTFRSEKAINHLAAYHKRGYRVGNAMSIVSTLLTISEESLDQFLLTVNAGVPFLMNSMPIGGLTGPYTMTSLATLAQAQALFGMVLAQLIHPGVKCTNAAMPTVADLGKKDMPLLFGRLSNTLVNILLAELNVFLGLPAIQSACSHSGDIYDESAKQETVGTYNLVSACRFHALRHLFGFASQLNDFSIDDMERQIELFRRINREPSLTVRPEPVAYDPEGLDAIIEGVSRGDFRNLDHTLKNVGRAFA